MINKDYGFPDSASRIAYDAAGKAQDYWLRSPYNGDYYARCVRYSGGVGSSDVYGSYGVRPALTRKLD